MSIDPEQKPEELFPLPKGVKIRTKKFGSKPCSELVPVSVGAATGPRSPFQIILENEMLGLTTSVREQEDGRLSATVFCGNAGLLGAAVAVGLTGSTAEHPICKTIYLTVPEANGCSGTADFGFLADAVKELGPQLGVVAFLMV